MTPTSRAKLFPVTSEPQAYALGLILGGCGRMKGDSIDLVVRSGAKHVARLLGQLLEGRLRVDGQKLRIRSAQLVEELQRAGIVLQAVTWQLADLEPQLRHACVRGIFDVAGYVPEYREDRSLYCQLSLPGSFAPQLEQCFIGAKIAAARGARATLCWRGVNALDMLGSLYDLATLFRKSQRRRYFTWAGALPPRSSHAGVLSFQWRACAPGAVAPFKARVSDSGYDLTLIREVKRHGSVVLYGTGLQVIPPDGWYFDVVPRSSIYKSGHIVANSVGVIDRSYRGELMVPLIKSDPAAPELELPVRLVQMIPRPIVHLFAEQIHEAQATSRGAGGFGSTGDHSVGGG